MSARELIDDLENILDEGRGYPPGTVRVWGSDKVEKQRDGSWKKVGAAETKTRAKKRKKLAPKGQGPKLKMPKKAVIDTLRNKYEGSLPKGKTFDEHIEIAKRVLEEHTNLLRDKLVALYEVAKRTGIPARVGGRVKRLESTIEKLSRYPGANTAEDLPDLTATRLVVKAISDIPKMIEKLKEHWGGAVWDADYVTNPRNGYRSFHMTTSDEDGREFEIQVRTENQDKWAEYSHATKYKPTSSPGASDAIRENSDVLDQYLLELSAYLHAKDTPGAPDVPKPDCPDVVKETVGCFSS